MKLPTVARAPKNSPNDLNPKQPAANFAIPHIVISPTIIDLYFFCYYYKFISFSINKTSQSLNNKDIYFLLRLILIPFPVCFSFVCLEIAFTYALAVSDCCGKRRWPNQINIDILFGSWSGG